MQTSVDSMILVTCSDSLPLSYKRLVIAMVIRLVQESMLAQ